MTNRLNWHEILTEVEAPAKVVGYLAALLTTAVVVWRLFVRCWNNLVPHLNRYQSNCLLVESFRKEFGEKPAEKLREVVKSMAHQHALTEIRSNLFAGQLHIGFYICRASTGESIFVNKTLADMWGVEAASMHGSGWLQCIEDKETALRDWKFAVQHGLPYRGMYRIRHAQNQRLFQVQTEAYLTDYDGNEKAYAGWVKIIGELPYPQADHTRDTSKQF